MSEKSRITLGLIGTGRIGRLHAEHLRFRLPAADLRVVTDLDRNSAQACADRCGIPRVAADHREILADRDLQAVVVCSPTDTHADIIEAAAAAGKHVFCEKPIEVNLQRIDRVLSAVAHAGVLLQIGFNRRFDANFQRIRKAVKEGEIGTPHQVHIISRDPAPPPVEYIRQSGGIFLDMTIHDFDMARFLIGSEVEEVYATGGVRIDAAIGEAGDLDTATILLKFADGTVGIVENSRQAVYGYDQRVEVFGSKGSIQAGNNYPNTCRIAGAGGVGRDLPLNFFMDRYTQSYLDEMAQFLEAIATDGPSPVSGVDARVPVVMARAACRSVQENRPVRLAEIEAEGASG
ncbi:MAG: inositol 2-dehydrogenase [Verrucomicrobiales bacterium]|nr:inositol 2-dehydrogenase [Verrucomicrobiales bacterium]MCP5525946.1 inositol 2-dehydrogenase [Verrucomicrobiales bacterium]